MNRKITREDEVEIYSDILRGNRQSDIAKKFRISQGHVSNIHKKITIRNDRDLAVHAALDFIGTYTKEKDYLEMKKRELEVILQNTADERLKTKIIMDQVALSQMILYHVSQRKFMQAVQEDTYALQAYMHTIEKPNLEEKE